MMNKLKIKHDSFADVESGSTLIVPNPKWDGDNPKTHFSYKVCIKTKICVLVQGDVEAYLITKIPA